jgi:hypothetical protein
VYVDLVVERAPELARELVSSGVDIQEIRPSERSLEDAFLEMTDGSGWTASEENPS